MGTQRTDLFGAVVSGVPLMDMLKFLEMGMRLACINVFGDPKVPEQGKVFQSCFPCHDLKHRVAYPPMLVTCSTLNNWAGVGRAQILWRGQRRLSRPIFPYMKKQKI
jgi:prolyl oligopeptidase PreP (S9A serine peptidase family)